jgi:hypothetical protein
MLRLAPDAPQSRGTVKVVFQLTDAPYTEFTTSQAQLTKNWTPYRLKAKAPQALDTGKSRIALQLAFGVQTVEVGPILVVKSLAIH